MAERILIRTDSRRVVELAVPGKMIRAWGCGVLAGSCLCGQRDRSLRVLCYTFMRVVAFSLKLFPHAIYN